MQLWSTWRSTSTNEETGYVWTWLSEARDPSVIAPERIVVVGDDDAIARARVVDLVQHENGMIVHVEILPGTVAEYFEAVARAAAIPAWLRAPAKTNPPGDYFEQAGPHMCVQAAGRQPARHGDRLSQVPG